MDEKVAKWILEFLLRKPSINDKIINSILETLPLSNTDTRLKKTLILRRIESEISSGSFSEKLLDFLEFIEELDAIEGKTASELLKSAYCSVAVDCTVRFLEENVKENGKYFEAVERVWRSRVCVVEGLGSEVSSRWWGDIESAVWDSSVCERVLGRNTRNEALRDVRRYLKEGWSSLGPTFLEFVAGKVGDRVEELRLGGGAGGDFEVVLSQGVQKSESIIRQKHVALKTKRPRGAKISDPDEDPEGATNTANNISIHKRDKVQEKTNIGTVFENQTKHVLPSTPEVTNVREALKTSAEDLRAVVTDPLPEALRTAETLCSMQINSRNGGVLKNQIRPMGPVQENIETNSMEARANVRNPSQETNFRTVEDESFKVATNSTRNDVLKDQIQPDIQAPIDPTKSNLEKAKKKDKFIDGAQGHKIRSNLEHVRKKEMVKGDGQGQPGRKRSLMEPNGTGHTLEWDDSIDDESSRRERVTLPSSSKRSRAGPLQPYIDKRLSRRERRKWTSQEEETLREGVKKFGRRWTFILEHYSDVFLDRTDGDLKDKWRNMLKYITLES